MLLGWGILIVLVINVIIIFLVGSYTGINLILDGVMNLQTAVNAGYRARVNFFREFGTYIQFFQGLLIFLLAALGKLPLTTKSD